METSGQGRRSDCVWCDMQATSRWLLLEVARLLAVDIAVQGVLIAATCFQARAARHSCLHPSPLALCCIPGMPMDILMLEAVSDTPSNTPPALLCPPTPPPPGPRTTS
jgi:hypothetical protein